MQAGSLRVVVALVLGPLALAACAAPPPSCAPKGVAYAVCVEDAVWSCPAGPDDVAADNRAIDEGCLAARDPVACQANADYRMVDMTRADDCAERDARCVEPEPDAPGDARCE
jgi:hypothetical protein